jgi:hypothetical protein
VDTAFLEEIERWRDLLARNFALRNPTLNVRDLNFAVQKTIDRLVFLGICEDRGTEDYGRLRTVINGTQTYPRLLELFRAADARYNSGLFHFSKEKGQAEEPDKWGKGKNATLYQAKGGEWRLTTAEKKRILLNNIHGVDIDAAAVEVTKLSLLLKVLEGETGEIAQRDVLKERERILPDLANNIKCGNSLIGPDFYDAPEMDLLDDESRFRVNVSDWKTGFTEVFKQGGFDCVFGDTHAELLIASFGNIHYSSRDESQEGVR